MPKWLARWINSKYRIAWNQNFRVNLSAFIIFSAVAMTFFSTAIAIAASPEEAWNILVDVEKWPAWTESMSSIRPLGTGPMATGARFEVKQPKLPVAKMTIVDWEPGHRFTWRSDGRALWAVADHILTPNGRGCTLTLNLRFCGPLAQLANLLADKLVRRYLQMEAEGLQAECVRRSGGQARGLAAQL